MLQLRSIVGVADNSGAKKVGVFKVLGGSRKRYAQIGDIVVCSVKSAEPRKAVKKKDVVRAVVVRQRNPYRRRMVPIFVLMKMPWLSWMVLSRRAVVFLDRFPVKLKKKDLTRSLHLLKK